MKENRKKLLAVLLVASMLITQLPPAFVYASANVEATPVPSVEEQIITSSVSALNTESSNEGEKIVSEAKVISEIEERRDENIKYFEMSDGTVKACIYPQAVHYLKDGVYEEIDNTLELVGEDTDTITDNVGTHMTTDTVETPTEEPETDMVGETEQVEESVTETVKPNTETGEAITDTTETITDAVGGQIITDAVDARTVSDMIETEATAQEDVERNEETEIGETESEVEMQTEEVDSETALRDGEEAEVIEEPEAIVGSEITVEPEVTAGLLETAEEEASYYENKANAFKVRLPSDYGTGCTEFLDENGYVRFKLLGTEKKKLKKEKGKEVDGEDKTVVKDVNSRAVYKSLQQDIDLEYDVVGNMLKETIVLNKKTKQDFVFSVETSANRTVQNENGSISFYGIDGTELYVISAPYMVDSAGEYTSAVEVELMPTVDGYTLTYRPDEEWLYEKEREYPVRIDPTMFKAVTVAKESVTDTYVGTMQTESNHDPRGGKGWDVINIGKRTDTIDGAQIKMRGMIRFNLPSELGENDCIVDAKLYLTHYPLDGYNSVDGIQIDVHELTGSFVESSTWWGDQPSYNTNAIDYAKVDTSQYFPDTEVSYDVYNITELANKWHNGGANNGLLLKLHDESTTVSSSKQVYYLSSSSVYFGDVSKFVEITYRNTLGMEEYWSYSAHDVGNAGTGYVNLYNGNLVFVHEDISNNTELNAFTLAHVFNNGIGADNSSRCGEGWRLNLLQWMKTASVPGNSKVKYVYTDGDGTLHYLVETDDGKIMDEDGLGYTFSETGNANLPWKLTTKDDTVMIFDGLGFLRYIDDTNGNRITFNFGTIQSGINYLTSISTSSGDTITLGYDSTRNYVTSATDKAGRKITYSYTNNKLTKITYPDGTSTVFTYSDDRLVSVREPSGSGYDYTYHTAGEVATVKQIGKNAAVGNKDTFSYGYCHTSITDSATYKTTYQFDTAGRVTCIFDSEGNICSQKHTDEKTSSSEIFKNNKVEVEAAGSKYVNNLLTNGTFVKEKTGWTESLSGGNAAIDTTKTLLTPKTMKITNSTSGVGVIRQTVSGASSGTYTLSGYVQGSSIEGSGGVGVQIVTNTRTITSELVQDPEDAVTDNGFSRVSATVTLDEDASENIIQVQAGLINAKGTAYIDSLQLEEGETTGPVNLLENSSFEKISSGVVPYAFSAGANIGASGRSGVNKKDGTYGLLLLGDSAYKRTYSQSVAISGKAGDAYTFGAWAAACSAEVHDDNKPFAMTLTFTNKDGTTTEKDITFNTAVNVWQFANSTVLAEKDYTGLKVTFRYENNVNRAYFDCAFLYRDTAMSYTYDSNGNIISTKDFASQNSEFQYSGNNLSKVLDPTGTGYEYIHDGKDRLIGAKSSEGNQYVINNYTNGNPYRVRTIAGDNSAAIQANETYYIRLKGSGKYLTVDGAGTTSNTNVSQAAFTGEDNQKWTIEQTADGYFRLRPAHATNKYLDVSGGKDTDGSNIIIYTNGTGDNQKFQIKPQWDYTYIIVPKCSTTEKKLSIKTPDSQNNATLESAAGADGYSWYFENVEDTPASTVIDGRVYRIRAYHSGKYLDVSNNGTSTGTHVNQYQLNHGKNQQYLFTKYENTEYYTIKPMHSTGNLLTVSAENSTVASGCKYLSIGDSTVTDEKLFKLEYDSTKRGFRIIPKSDTSKALDVVQGYLTNGTEVIFYPKTTSDNRYFLLEECTEEIESTIAYTSDGNYVSATTDERGNSTSYSYDDTKDLLLSTTNTKGISTSYTYNTSNDRLLSVTSDDATVSYGYNTDGSLNGITSPSGTTYGFTYDNYGRRLATTVGSRTLGSYTYLNNYSSLVSKFTFGNGIAKEYTYDSSDRVVTERVAGKQAKGYTYDKFGNVAKENNYVNGSLLKTTTFRYDLSGRLTGFTDTIGQKINYVYDKYNRITHEYYTTGDNDVTTACIYGNNVHSSSEKTGLIYGVKYDGTERIHYNYDDLNRVSSRITIGDDTAAGATYKYLKGAGANQTTTLVSEMMLSYSTSSTASTTNWDIYNYTYDTLGNIETISKNGELQETYLYDSKNQLKGVVIGDNEVVRAYTYDSGGNIIRVNEGVNGVNTQIKTYTYGDGEWKDLLTSYNGDTITYDSIGNPLNYRDGMEMTWINGRQLFYISGLSSNVSYLYDGDGYRTHKQVGANAAIRYNYVDGVLRSEEYMDRQMIYLYDESGLASGVKVIEDGVVSTYFYQLNLQGDVIGILDEAGIQVAAYTYDEWGKVLSVTGSDANGIGKLNPIRYRGYYYDSETGFYYLNSRYYDPETGRFINADDEGILKVYPMLLRDKNLFAYCDCNPIVREDVYGMLWDTVFDIVSLCISVADVCSDPTDPWAWAGLGGDAVDVLVPFLFGVGEGIKSAKLLYKVDEVADATKAINKSGKLQDPGFNYTPKVQRQMKNVKDLNHSFPTIVDATVDLKKAQPIIGVDGILRQIVKVPGSINDRMGMYEYIIEVDGKINHRFFKAIE